MREVRLIDASEMSEQKAEKEELWLNLGRIEPMYDIYGVKTWGTVYQCPKCGFTTTAVEDHIGQYNYCPNCGIQNIKEVTE